MGMEHATLAAPLSLAVTVTPASMEDSVSTNKGCNVLLVISTVCCATQEKETMWQLLVIGINVLAIRY